MFCQKCGKEIADNAAVCTYCGCAVSGSENKDVKKATDDPSLGIVIGTWFLPILGIIMGIVSLCQKKTRVGIIYLFTGIGFSVLYMMFAMFLAEKYLGIH